MSLLIYTIAEHGNILTTKIAFNNWSHRCIHVHLSLPDSSTTEDILQTLSLLFDTWWPQYQVGYLSISLYIYCISISFFYIKVKLYDQNTDSTECILHLHLFLVISLFNVLKCKSLDINLS